MYNHKSHIKLGRKKCPFCDPNFKPRDPWRGAQCVLNKPLFMVIPPEGVHLECPVHPERHHVFGPGITWMRQPYMNPFRFEQDDNLPDPWDKPWCEYQHDASKDLTYDSTKPYGTTSGSGITKFRM